LQPPQPAAELHVDFVQRSLGEMEDPIAAHHRETMAACSTRPTAPRKECPIHQSPIMIEVPPVRIPEEPGAVIPHAGICEGVVGKPASLP
jgi:hypothetical protein